MEHEEQMLAPRLKKSKTPSLDIRCKTPPPIESIKNDGTEPLPQCMTLFVSVVDRIPQDISRQVRRANAPESNVSAHQSGRVRLAHRHRHAQRLQAIESLRMRHRRRRRAIGHRVKGCGDVGVLRARRGFLEGTEVVLTRVLLLVFAREVKAAFGAIATIVGSLVSTRTPVSSCLSCA